MDTDLNLLFGVLALHADLIDSSQFIEVCTAWASRKNTPLAELLIEKRWITRSDKEHLDYLLERKLMKHGGDPKAGLAAVSDDIKRSLAALDDQEVSRSLAGLPRTDCHDPDATIDSSPSQCDRHRLTRLQATGGIGRVWLARNDALGRDVALKELRPERANDPVLKTRFLREARITGQLEHPGVIPVYELSMWPETRKPYYTMRFVKGQTLTEAARDYSRKRLNMQTDSFEFVSLLNAFVTVCNTIAYAHARGVIHRDLKGQNIILGDFGEVVVLDWGLAKFADHHEHESSSLWDDLDQESTCGLELTVQGQTIGTPAYMAPEQAAGRPDLIDRRTDIYGLGAILYEILTGHPPFIGSDTREILRKVREEEPAPPRVLFPEVPPALEAACLRALAKHPEDRFPSASDLALEVQGWQEVERRQAEEALRESEALYHSLVESLPQNIYRKDLEGRFTFSNQRMCATLGLSPENLIGKTDFEVFPRELAEKYRRDDRWVVETGRTFEAVEEQVTPKGKRLFVQVVKTAIHDTLGRPLGTQGIWWDITEKTLAEEELRKSRERYELVVLGSQDGLWDLDLRSGEIYFSPRYQSMLGYEDREMPSHIDQWVERIHPEDRERSLGALRSYCDGHAPIYEAEFRLRHKDGSYRWVLSRGAALRDGEGRPYRMAGSHEDITARKHAEERLRESEERYRAVIGAIQDGIMLIDADGTILTCNESAERILGRPTDQMTGMLSSDPNWRTIREDGSPFPHELNPATITLQTGESCSNMIMGVYRPDGALTWLSINSQRLVRPGQANLHDALITFSDITESIRIQKSHSQAVTGTPRGTL